jgi:hypothetical protein
MRQDTEIIEALRRRQAAIEMHSSLSWPTLSPASASLLNGPTLMNCAPIPTMLSSLFSGGCAHEVNAEDDHTPGYGVLA